MTPVPETASCPPSKGRRLPGDAAARRRGRGRTRAWATLAVTALGGGLAALALPGGAQAAATIPLPPANKGFDYQIGGGYTPERPVAVVDRDHSDVALARNAAGGAVYSICYVNGFQTQPGDETGWPAGSLLGTQDPNWPGEYLADSRTAASRQLVMNVVGPWIKQCKSNGFQAVELDNLDTYTRPEGSKNGLTRDGNAALATLMVQQAHGLGLAVAQKNSAEDSAFWRQKNFDFAVTEECFYNGKECSKYTSVYGNLVFDVEYKDFRGGNGKAAQPGYKNFAAFKAAVCSPAPTFAVNYRDRPVLAPGATDPDFPGETHVSKDCTSSS